MIHLIAFLSALIYLWKVLYDCSTYNHGKYKYHIGYAIISLLTLIELELYPVFLIMLIGIICYSALVLLTNNEKNV